VSEGVMGHQIVASGQKSGNPSRRKVISDR
jgi:hypothetical protein